MTTSIQFRQLLAGCTADRDTTDSTLQHRKRTPKSAESPRHGMRHVGVLVAVGLTMAGVVRSQTYYAGVTNYGFESGTISGWTVGLGANAPRSASISNLAHSGAHSLAVTGS